MFWDTTYSNSANIDALLNKEECSLKELLEDEDILQECKTQNQKLVKFLNRPEVVDELVSLITTEPPADLDEKQRFLYPNMACEILTSDMPSLKQRMVEDPAIMNKLFSFFEQTTELNPLLASFICKTFGTLIIKKMEQDWFLYQTICLHVLEFIKSKDNFLECMVRHFSTPVIMDLLLTMLNEVEDAKMKSNFLEWINEMGLIERMIDVLRVPNESEKHIIVAQFLIEVIKTGRCNRQNDTEDRKGLQNPLLQRMEDPQTASRLIDVILCETRTESGILSGLQVLLCLLENSIIQEPVSQTALQQIIDAEKEHHDEIIASLMGIIQPRVHHLFELLLNPPVKTLNYALTPSLGNVRLQLCNLFTVLLETENSSIIEEICKTTFFTELLNLFKQYCWNNFLHNYVKKCLIYGVQAFDTIPNNTQLVISALQMHIVNECSVANKLIDCWNANMLSQQQEQGGGRRLGYMGHLIDILSAINSTISASEEFRALIESSLTSTVVVEGSGEPSPESSKNIIDTLNQILEVCEDELTVQKRLLADCDPNDRHDYGREGLIGFPSIPDDSENDTEDFSYHFNPSMHNAVNGMNDFNDDLSNEDDMESRNKFEETCDQNTSTLTFDNWDQQQFFNSARSVKSYVGDIDLDENEDFQLKDPFNRDPFELNTAATTTSDGSGFNSIIDNFADFDSHFTSMTPATFSLNDSANSTLEDDEEEIPPATSLDSYVNDDEEELPCFIATTQVLEISSVPPQQTSSPIKFLLGPNITSADLTATAAPITTNIKSFDELDDEEFFSLRDDSNDMSSLTEDFDKKFTFENTEVPEDDDDDFASADESSSKGNSEEETNSNNGDQFVDCIISPTTTIDDEIKSNENNNDEHKEKVNGIEKSNDKAIGSNETHTVDVDDDLSKLQSSTLDKLAQTPEEENMDDPVVNVTVENGSA